VFPIQPPKYVTPQLVDFVRAKISNVAAPN
jgi:hypothetical protein